MASSTEEKKVKIIADGKQAEASINQITKAYALLNRERAKEKIGSDRYKELTKDLSAMNTKLSQARNEVKSLEITSQKFGRNFKDVMAGVVGGNLITSAITQLKDLAVAAISFQAKLSDSFSDIKKVTGLTDEQVKQLDETLQSFDTRTSAEDLRQLAVEAGKLGEEGVDAIAKFVKEADQIKVALGQDLGPEAITQIGRLSKIFKVSLLEIGSAINEIGAQSAATESFQVDFLNRLAGTGPAVNLAADQLLGYSATLENAGQSAEVSGTALSQFFLKFIKNVESFGAVAGMQKGQLTDLLNSQGTNAAFLAFLENLKKSKGGADTLARALDEMGIDGARSSGVFLALSNNIEEVRKQQTIANQAIVQGTSLTKEFNTKNENFAASLDKLKKVLTNIFVDNVIVRGISRLIGGFADLITKSDGANEQFQKMISNERSLQNEMNVAFSVLTKTNLSTDARKVLISEINKKYGEYLPNLITEKSSLQEIAKAQTLANKAFERKILLQKFEKELGDTTSKIIDLEKQKIENEIEYQKYYTKFLQKESTDRQKAEFDRYRQRVELINKGLDKELSDSKSKLNEIKKVFSETSKSLLGEDVTIPSIKSASNDPKTDEIAPYFNSNPNKNKDKINNDLKLAKDLLEDFERNITLLKIDNEYERQQMLIQLDFESDEKRIKELQITEDKKTELILAAKKLRDEKLLELEQEKKAREDAEKAREDAKQEKAEEKQDDKEQKANEDKQERLKEARKHAETELYNELKQQGFAFVQQEFDEKYARLINELDKQREIELSNKSLTEEQKQQINLTYDQKRKDILNEQARKEKQLALFRIGVDTAVAAVSALKTDPTGILSAIIVAQGIAQAAVVGAKDVPQFAGGGNTLVRGSSDGNLYSADNVGSIAGGGVYNKPSLGLVGEKGAELVIPNWLYSSPRMANTMSALESMIYNARPFAAGGNTVVNNVPGADNTEIANALKMNAAIMLQLKNNLDKGFVGKINWGQSEQTEFEKFTNRIGQVKTISEL